MHVFGSLLERTESGLYCPAGDFHIDPWAPVARAVVTHAHADHARWGSEAYLTAARGMNVLRARLGPDARLEGMEWGESRTLGSARVSFHPAGHILGSAQIRIEHGGRVCVVTGDYKRHADPTVTPFEPVRCHALVTESTFGLPVFRWPDPAEEMAALNDWWRANRDEGRTSLVYAYSLGKAQRILAGLEPEIGPILVHGAVETLLPAYRSAGVTLPPVRKATRETAKALKGKALVVAPPSAAGTPWTRKFAPSTSAFASGWMSIRGFRRRRAGDRGFVVSDHVDWADLLETVRESEAREVAVTHGYAEVVARFLREERGLDAVALPTRFRGETLDSEAES
ncbi:MAG: ligase-associated DNA damage response exonuclease [Gemmatimonadota bacterium]